MSNQLLSAAVDAAATEAEWDALLEAAEHDPAINAEWSRIWALRNVQDNVALAGSADFCSGVMAAIAQEKPLPSNVVQMPSRRIQPAAPVTKAPATWRTLVPLSAAAGVVAAVLMVNVLRDAPETAQPGLSASSTSSAITTPVSFNPERMEATQPDAAKAAILNAYLMEHSNSLAERSMGSTLANARFAARTADYRPDAP